MLAYIVLVTIFLLLFIPESQTSEHFRANIECKQMEGLVNTWADGQPVSASQDGQVSMIMN